MWRWIADRIVPPSAVAAHRLTKHWLADPARRTSW